MRVKVKLMGLLKAASPADGTLEVPDEATIAEVLAQLEVDGQAVQVVSVNGSLQRDKQARLKPNDEMLVVPPIGGG